MTKDECDECFERFDRLTNELEIVTGMLLSVSDPTGSIETTYAQVQRAIEASAVAIHAVDNRPAIRMVAYFISAQAEIKRMKEALRDTRDTREDQPS